LACRGRAAAAPAGSSTLTRVSGISCVGVVGMGTMGAGIAQVVAHHRYEVVACDVSADRVAAGLERVAAGYDRHVGRDRMSPTDRAAALARVRAGTDPAALADCDLVIEAVVEELDVKRDLFAGLGGICRRDAILATNTSALSVTAIGAATAAPERVVGLHFFNPAPVLPLVEVVVTQATDPAVAERVRAFAATIGKQPIVCPDRPGFVVNRILIPLLNDCVSLYAEGGISARDLDRAMTAGLNWPMGPLALIDLIGADTHLQASRALRDASGDPRAAPPRLLEEMVEAGRLGRKTGTGFHVYE
jgi:3-hydroxybutyryl-CoA dehydrogenase